jgi:thioredoxin reductase (NADPH)
MVYDIIIVGAGMAGLTAALYAGRAGKKVLVLERGAHGGQIITSLKVENWPGCPGVTGADLMKTIYEQVKELDVDFEYVDIDKIEKDGVIFKILGEDETFEAKTVILAMGTVPRKLSEKQAADAGDRPISYCATCDGALYKGKPVVVVGSGNTAKHEMSYLEGICSKVYHIHHDDPIPEDAEAVFVAIGRVPGAGFLKDFVDVDEKGFVIAGEDCKTSQPGIFVAGDCRTKPLHQLVTAAADGAVAVAAATEYLEDK